MRLPIPPRPHVICECEGNIRALFRKQPLNPKPATELEYASPFELLVAVTLSAQATDVGVNKATRKLFPVANTPRAMHGCGR